MAERGKRISTKPFHTKNHVYIRKLCFVGAYIYFACRGIKLLAYTQIYINIYTHIYVNVLRFRSPRSFAYKIRIYTSNLQPNVHRCNLFTFTYIYCLFEYSHAIHTHIYTSYIYNLIYVLLYSYNICYILSCICVLQDLTRLWTQCEFILCD